MNVEPKSRINPEQNSIRLLEEREVAQILSLSVRTLQGWRVGGSGPRFVKLASKLIRYRADDLEDWIENRCVTSTSAYRDLGD